MLINQKDITIKSKDFPVQVWTQDAEEKPIFDERLTLEQIALYPIGEPYLIAGAIVGHRFIFGDVSISVDILSIDMNLRFIKHRSITVPLHEIGVKRNNAEADLIVARALALVIARCQDLPDLEVHDNNDMINISKKTGHVSRYPISQFKFPNISADYFVTGFHVEKAQVKASLEVCGIKIEKFDLDYGWYMPGTAHYRKTPDSSYIPITTIIERIPTGQIQFRE